MPSAECRQILGGQKRAGAKALSAQAQQGMCQRRRTAPLTGSAQGATRAGRQAAASCGQRVLAPQADGVGHQPQCNRCRACRAHVLRGSGPHHRAHCAPRPQAGTWAWHRQQQQAVVVASRHLVREWCRSTQCQSACPSGRMHHKDLFDKYAPTALTDRAFAGSPLSLSLTWSSAPGEELQPRARRHLLHCW